MSGLRAVTDMGLLARLLRLPLVGLVPWKDLSSDDQRILRTAADGIVDCSPAGVQRVLVQPASVPLVLVREEADPGGAGCELRAFSSRSHSAC